MDPNAELQTLRAEISRLAHRLDALELRLRDAEADHERSAEERVLKQSSPAEVARDRARQFVERRAEEPPPVSVPTSHSQSAPPTAPPADHPSAAAPHPPVATVPRAPNVSTQRATVMSQSEPSTPRSLEVLIGGKWMAWVGALVVVIGAGFLAAVIDVASIWGALPAAVKCAILASFGAALIGGGEYVLRRVNHYAAVGLYAAGIGTWYITAYATFGYDLFAEPIAFILLAVVAVIGFAFGVRTNSVTIGILSTIGGYLAPTLLQGASTFDAALPLYLSMLFAVALALSAFKPQPFRPLRYVAVSGQTILALFWMLDAGMTAWAYFLVFGGAWWCMLLAETVYAALRGQSTVGNGIAMVHATWAYVTAANIVLWSTAAGASAWSGAFTAAIALVAAVTALQFGPGLDGLRAKTRNAMDVLAVILWIQAAVLIPIAIALQFDGFAQSVSWLIVGAAAVEAGRQLRARSVDLFGCALGVLGLSKVFLWDSWAVTGMHQTLVAIQSIDVTITLWTLLALIAVALTLIAAHRMRATAGVSFWRVLATLMAVAGVGVWFTVCVVQAGTLAATVGWLIAAVAFLLVGRMFTGSALQHFHLGRIFLLLVGVKWMAYDLLFERVEGIWRPFEMLPFVNAQMMVGVLIAITMVWVSRVRLGDAVEGGDGDASPSPLALAAHPYRWFAAWLPVVMSLMLLWGLSFEVDRLIARLESSLWPDAHLRVLWMALLWGAGGFVMAAVGRLRSHAPLAAAGPFVLCSAAITWLFFGTILLRVLDGPIADVVFVNPQALVGIGLIALLGAVAWMDRGSMLSDMVSKRLPEVLGGVPIRGTALTLIALIGLWIGSLEIDRFFAADAMARQTGWSIWWAVYGIVLIAIGFIGRTAIARYAGLAMLGITLVKVGLIDTSQLEGVYRPMSYIALGLILVGTSIGYAKLSPRILAMMDDAEGERTKT